MKFAIQEDKEKLSYIYKYILYRLNDVKDSFVLTSHFPPTSRFIASFDCGGQIYPSTNFVALIESAESVFRAIPDTAVSEERFVSE